MKICVYAIAKNEAQFVDRWMDSMSEADYICVLETGSADNTADLLRARGAHVEQTVINPWRFDVARNASMLMIPEDADVCVCTDLDEVLAPGWREKLEAKWRPGVTTRARYTYVWNHNADGTDGVKFLGDKIHARNYHWKSPVHEYLVADKLPEVYAEIPEIRIDHWADNSKSRTNYLPLLELAVREDPDNDRNMHYLGREYMFHRQWEKAIETLKRHLKMPSAVWMPERAASMRYIARCYNALGDFDAAELWLSRAIATAHDYREPWVEMERLMYEQERWDGVIYYGYMAVGIGRRKLDYISDPEAWGALPWDLLSIAQWNLGNMQHARECAKKALQYSPGDERIKRNLTFMED